MKKLGVKFTQEPTPMGPVTRAVFDDTCGNLIQIYQKVVAPWRHDRGIFIATSKIPRGVCPEPAKGLETQHLRVWAGVTNKV